MGASSRHTATQGHQAPSFSSPEICITQCPTSAQPTASHTVCGHTSPALCALHHRAHMDIFSPLVSNTLQSHIMLPKSQRSLIRQKKTAAAPGPKQTHCAEPAPTVSYSSPHSANSWLLTPHGVHPLTPWQTRLLHILATPSYKGGLDCRGKRNL